MDGIHRRLAYRLGLMVFVVEALTLAAFGLYYTKTFNRAIDAQVEQRAKLPARLIRQGALEPKALANRQLLGSMLGEAYVQGMLIEADDRTVRISLEPGRVGKKFSAISEAGGSPAFPVGDRPLLYREHQEDACYLTCISPAAFGQDGEPLSYAYVRMKTCRAEAEKTSVWQLFLAGSLLCVLVSSLLLLVGFRCMASKRVRRIVSVLQCAEGGDLAARVEPARQADEIDALAAGVDAMLARVQAHTGELEQYKSRLEERVAERTQELQRANEDLEKEMARRKQAQEEMEETARFSGEDPNPVLRMSRDGVILYANAASRVLLDHWKTEVGRPIPLEMRSLVRYACTSGERQITEIHCEDRLFSCVVVAVKGRGYVNIYAHEITEHRQLEKRLRRSEKMQAIGQLAGGIAHEFNNQLAVINGFAELLLMRLKDDEELGSRAQHILSAGQHAATLTSQLLAYSREQVTRPQTVRLDEILNSMRKMLKQVVSEDIELDLCPDAEDGFVEVDRGQFSDVVLNLVSNACDAMPRGGRLAIETRHVTLGMAQGAGELDIRPGPCVALVVTDTGVGMDGNTRTHAFDPFFTTKPVGKGTGLGLSMVYGAVKRAGGGVRLRSEVEKGTTVEIFLPRVEAKAEAHAPRREAGRDAGPCTETLLVVEDEERVLDLLYAVFTEKGYQVLKARTGREALAVVDSYHRRIDLVLTDIIMPGMNGVDLAERLRGKRPEARILFASGYGRDMLERHGLSRDEVEVIQKPYVIRELLTRVRRALDEKAGQDRAWGAEETNA